MPLPASRYGNTPARLHTRRHRRARPLTFRCAQCRASCARPGRGRDKAWAALFNNSRRSYAWGAAIAALQGITFDRELLYVAAMFHDTGLPSPIAPVELTVARAPGARPLTS